MILNFKSFVSTVAPWFPKSWSAPLQLLVDAQTGAPIGIQNKNAVGPDGIWVPVQLTAAQIADPTSAMIADLTATYCLNVAPYTRYQSDGTTLVAIAAGASPDGTNFQGSVLQTIPPGAPEQFIGTDSYAVVYEPLTIQNEGGLTVSGDGRLDVIARPA